MHYSYSMPSLIKFQLNFLRYNRQTSKTNGQEHDLLDKDNCTQQVTPVVTMALNSCNGMCQNACCSENNSDRASVLSTGTDSTVSWTGLCSIAVSHTTQQSTHSLVLLAASTYTMFVLFYCNICTDQLILTVNLSRSSL